MLPTLGAGLGLKPDFYDDALECGASGLWWEVHPENYMVAGGPRLQWLERIAQRHPISLHSVSLSLGSEQLPDGQQLARLLALAQRVQPALVSEHLAWSVADHATQGNRYHPDLLPVVRNRVSLDNLVRNIDCVQNALGRSIALENPSHYLPADFGLTLGWQHEWDEIAFLTELHRRTGCSLLLDVNNVFVSANNLGFAAEDYIDQFPAHAVSEVHLAGHTQDAQWGAQLLIDSHDQAISAGVWALYERLIRRIGARPTLIERDDNLPAFAELLHERGIAQTLLEQVIPVQQEHTSPLADGALPAVSPPMQIRDTAAAQGLSTPYTQAFSAALLASQDDTASPTLAVLSQHAGFVVYRNTVCKGYIDSLAANYPTVMRMVGEQWFYAAAQAYMRSYASSDPRLLLYGQGFDAFLADLPAVQEMPYLPCMASLDRAWTLAHIAADAPALGMAGLQTVAQALVQAMHMPSGVTEALSPEASPAPALVLRPHPSAQWHTHTTLPIATLWQRARDQRDEDQALDWVGESIWLSRLQHSVVWRSASAAGCAFLDACAQGLDLATACEHAVAQDSALDLTRLLLQLVQAGMLQDAATSTATVDP